MPIAVPCTNCSHVLNIPEEYLGKVGKCPACGSRVKLEPEEKPAVEPVPQRQPTKYDGSYVLADILQFAGLIIVAAGIVAGIYIATETENAMASVSAAAGGIVSGLFLVGFGSILRCLCDIALNTRSQD